MFGTCAQSCAVPLPTRLPVITCSPTAKNFFRNEEPHWQTTKRGMPRRQLSSPKTCLILAKTSSAPLCVWCGTLEDFPTAGPDSLLLFINEYPHLVGLHLFFFYPSNYFLLHSSLSGPFVMYISGMFLSILQQQKVMLSFIYFSCLPYL